jgi:hypothetical protein
MHPLEMVKRSINLYINALFRGPLVSSSGLVVTKGFESPSETIILKAIFFIELIDRLFGRYINAFIFLQAFIQNRIHINREFKIALVFFHNNSDGLKFIGSLDIKLSRL